MLTVHEPLPPPTINKTLRGCNATGCSFTLQCLTPNTSSNVSCRWEILHHSFNECTIQVLLAFSSLGTEYVCFISNPAGKQVASVTAWQLCSVSGKIMMQCFIWGHWLLIVLGLIVTVLLAIALVKHTLYKTRCTKKRKDSKDESKILLNKNKKDGPKQARQVGNISVEPKAGLMKQMKQRISSKKKKRQMRDTERTQTGQ
eukprot:XP_012825191.1 PREDICTED: SLAM family member 8-like [Xenopus tropicalis]